MSRGYNYRSVRLVFKKLSWSLESCHDSVLCRDPSWWSQDVLPSDLFWRSWDVYLREPSWRSGNVWFPWPSEMRAVLSYFRVADVLNRNKNFFFLSCPWLPFLWVIVFNIILQCYLQVSNGFKYVSASKGLPDFIKGSTIAYSTSTNIEVQK